MSGSESSLSKLREAALVEWVKTHPDLKSAGWIVNALRPLLAKPLLAVDEVSKKLSRADQVFAVELTNLLNSVRPVAEEASAPRPAIPMPAAVPQRNPEMLADVRDQEQLSAVLERFVPMDFSEPEVDQVGLKVGIRGAEANCSWGEGPPAPFRVYRLVTSDTSNPYSPGAAEVLCVTTGTKFTDARAMTTAVRHYQVWCNGGDDLDSAQLEQPVMIAKQAVVAQPMQVVIKDEIQARAGGRTARQVIGRWRTLPGAKGVQIFRMPAAEARAAGRANPAYRINTNDPALGGFQDNDVQVGEYIYQLFVEAELDGAVQLSAPLTVPHAIKPTLESISDLVAEDGPGSTLELAWTAPAAAQVAVYRTKQPPESGLAGTDFPTAELPRLGFSDETLLPHPVETSAGISRMKQVSVPEGWARAYFTPVHLVGDRARIGNSALSVVMSPVTDIVIHQRVTRQVITFGWPKARDGETEASQASGVNVFEAAPEIPVDAAIAAAPIAQVSRDQYDHDGGVLIPRPLRATGSMVHLVPYAYLGQQQVAGPPASVSYPGLLQIRYELNGSWRVGLRRRRRVEIFLTADRDLPSAPRFHLVHNPERLPLCRTDGAVLPVQASAGGRPESGFRPTTLTTQPSGESWVCEVDQPGYLRLFAELSTPEQVAVVALIDPPARDLRCML